MQIQELTRVAENIKLLQEQIVNQTMVIEVSSPNGRISARIKIEQAFYDSCSIYTTTTQTGEKAYKISGYPVTEFHSILSIITPLLPKLQYLAKNPQFLTTTIAQDAHRDLLRCEKLLTVRDHIVNSEITPDWDSSIEPNPPDNIFLSVFPFRDSFYVTMYIAQKTDEPPREMHVHVTPFNYSPKSVIQINGQNYMIEHSIVASQSQQFLTQMLRCLRAAIEDLETLSALNINLPSTNT